MAFGMISDTIDYGQWKTGIRAVGMGNAGISTAQKLADCKRGRWLGKRELA